MSAQMLFAITYVPFLAAAVLGIVLDAARGTRVTLPVVAGLLLGGGVAAMVGGWSFAPAAVFGTFAVGRVFSVVPGAVGVLAALTVASGIHGQTSATQRQNAVLIALSVIGAGLAASTTDLTALLLALETSAVCAYALVASGRSARAGEASMKYFVQGAVATGLAVAGVAVLAGLYAPSGSYSQLASALDDPSGVRAVLLGCVLLVAALAFKSGAAPFHSWAPDAYETAPPSAAAFMAGAAKISAVAALAWFVTQLAPIGSAAARPLGTLGTTLLPTVAGIAVVSVVVGSLVALRQRSYTRMLAYAGIAQVGYALIAIAALNPPSAIIAVVTYAVSATGSFLSAEAFRRADPTWDGTIDGLSGLGVRHPVLGAAVTLIMMSLAGIPPLLGFWGKFQAFGASISMGLALDKAGYAQLGSAYVALAAIGIAGSVVSLAYYGSVLRALFFTSAEPETGDRNEVGVAGGIVVGIGVALLVIGLLPLVIGIPTTVWGFLLR